MVAVIMVQRVGLVFPIPVLVVGNMLLIFCRYLMQNMLFYPPGLTALPIGEFTGNALSTYILVPRPHLLIFRLPLSGTARLP